MFHISLELTNNPCRYVYYKLYTFSNLNNIVLCRSTLHDICFIIPGLTSVVHRIGRTGRCGKTGIATTFINKMCGK